MCLSCGFCSATNKTTVEFRLCFQPFDRLSSSSCLYYTQLMQLDSISIKASGCWNRASNRITKQNKLKLFILIQIVMLMACDSNVLVAVGVTTWCLWTFFLQQSWNGEEIGRIFLSHLLLLNCSAFSRFQNVAFFSCSSIIMFYGWNVDFLKCLASNEVCLSLTHIFSSKFSVTALSQYHLAFALSLATSSPVPILKERWREPKEALVKTRCVCWLRRSGCEEGIGFLICTQIASLLLFCWQPLSNKLGLMLRMSLLFA